jgi:hypothetical protein
MKVRAGIAALIIISFLSLSGCAQRESRVENFHGTSFELAKFNQIVNLDAENNTVAVDTLDGNAADNLIDAYRKSFLPGKTESKQSVVLGQ